MIPFKEPYIEMYENLRDGIIEGDFSAESIEAILAATGSAISRDCHNCRGISKLKKLRNFVRKGAKNLRGQSRDYNFTLNALALVKKTLKNFQALPDNLVGIVDQASFDNLGLRYCSI